MNAPRDDLIRGLTECRAKDDGNTMVGYPVVFNEWTEINSWEGRFRERIHPGAVTKTLKERRDQVKVQFDHGMHPVIGSLPLGKPEVMRADDTGMWTETPLSDTSYNRDLIRPLIADGAIDGMSFRFSVTREEWEEKDGELPERTVLELRLMEFGPVTWPAYAATQVGIRSQAAFAMWRESDPDQRAELVEQFGLAVDLAKDPEAAARVYAVLASARDQVPDAAGNGTSDAPPDAASDGTSEREDAPADDGHPSIKQATRPRLTPEDRLARLRDVKDLVALSTR